MRFEKNITGLLTLGLLLAFQTMAIAREWTTESTDDGDIIVKSKIYEMVSTEGEETQVIEYVVTTMAAATVEECVTVMKNVNNHKAIMDDKESRIIETISENEWVLYYYTNSPWPMPDSDCVTRMVFTEDREAGTASFHVYASPTDYPYTTVDRMVGYDVTYTFESLTTEQVQITVTAMMSPVIQAPIWLVKSMFPEGPADVLRNILAIASNS